MKKPEAPSTTSDLSDYEPAENMGSRSYASRQYAQDGANWPDDALCKLLDVDVVTLQSLKHGVYDRMVTPDGDVIAVDPRTMPAWQKKVVALYSRWVHSTEVCAPRVTPVVKSDRAEAALAEDVAAQEAEDAMVKTAKSAIRGLNGSQYASTLSVDVRLSILSDVRLTNWQTLGAVLDVSAEKAREYVLTGGPSEVQSKLDALYLWAASGPTMFAKHKTNAQLSKDADHGVRVF